MNLDYKKKKNIGANLIWQRIFPGYFSLDLTGPRQAMKRFDYEQGKECGSEWKTIVRDFECWNANELAEDKKFKMVEILHGTKSSRNLRQVAGAFS